jgi:hypothetical protein
MLLSTYSNFLAVIELGVARAARVLSHHNFLLTRGAGFARPRRSAGPHVLKAPSGSESGHSPCAKHVEGFDRAKDHRDHGNNWKEIQYSHQRLF